MPKCFIYTLDRKKDLEKDSVHDLAWYTYQGAVCLLDDTIDYRKGNVPCDVFEGVYDYVCNPERIQAEENPVTNVSLDMDWKDTEISHGLTRPLGTPKFNINSGDLLRIYHRWWICREDWKEVFVRKTITIGE